MMMHSGFGDRLNETGGLSHDDAGVLQSQRFAYMGRCITVQSDPMLAIEAGRKREESPWCGPVWSGVGKHRNRRVGDAARVLQVCMIVRA